MENFKIIADYHTHTTYSDGKGSIEDNVKSAIAKGLKEIGIADHGMGHLHHGLKRKNLKDIRSEVDELKDKYKGQIKIFLGVEANILSCNGDIDVTDEDRKYFDLVLMGYHRFVGYKSISDWSHFLFKGLRQKDNQYLIEKSTDAFINAVTKNKINIVTHPSDPLPINLDRFTPVCNEVGTSLEINCKHKNLDNLAIEKLANMGAKLIVGSDAHTPENVGGFDFAYNILQKANIPFDSVLNIDLNKK